MHVYNFNNTSVGEQAFRCNETHNKFYVVCGVQMSNPYNRLWNMILFHQTHFLIIKLSSKGNYILP